MNAIRVMCYVLVALISMAVLIQAGPVVDDQSKGHIDNMVNNDHHQTIEESLMKKLNSKCSSRDISACMMLKLITYFNRMLKKASIEVGDLEITQTSTETVTLESESTSRSLNPDNMSEDAQLGQVLADKVYSFVRTRSLKWKVLDGAEIVIDSKADKDGGINLGFSLRPVEESVNGESRKKKGGDNGMGAIMAAAIMKIGLLKALAFKALVLLVGKALLVSKLALVLAAVIGLKKLLHSEKHVTYEVVAHPHHEHHHEHHDDHGSFGGGGGGWGRNFDAKQAQNLAYSAHVPAN